ncbi:MAG: nucleoside deaminase [Epsilonproteobacteria bacterium]|nr:nucleoside deaminase [Campylobacterota bacterium]
MHRWMKIAYDEAIEGILSNDGGPFGAVITKDDELIAKAHNRVLTTNDPTAHAEVNVIREASQKLSSFDLSGCTLYTTCMPCPMCLGAIFWARIKTVYYGSTEADAQKAGFDDKIFYDMLKDKNHSLELKQLDAVQTSKLFDKWLEKEDRQIY